jgi:hypothetical protein
MTRVQETARSRSAAEFGAVNCSMSTVSRANIQPYCVVITSLYVTSFCAEQTSIAVDEVAEMRSRVKTEGAFQAHISSSIIVTNAHIKHVNRLSLKIAPQQLLHYLNQRVILTKIQSCIYQSRSND